MKIKKGPGAPGSGYTSKRSCVTYYNLDGSITEHRFMQEIQGDSPPPQNEPETVAGQLRDIADKASALEAAGFDSTAYLQKMISILLSTTKSKHPRKNREQILAQIFKESLKLSA